MADHFDSSDFEDSFASPSKPPQPQRSKTPTNQNTRFDTQESREAALRKELDGVKKINRVIEGLIGTLERAQGNMGTVSQTVNNTSTLLNTWTRILSQTEHNQRLILNPEWKGATQDLVDMESEALQKQQEAERRAAEVERRREEARRKAEEDERKRTAGTATSSSRGIGRGLTRGRVRPGVTRGGATSSSSAYGADTTSGSGASSRPASGIGRGGFGYTRGATRSRGTR
ncbi:hypothetical protein N0V88_005404 [Collariella sp. IMI 366227]|nr:hypothetical protein N0V88_005404 [Collariella sp. IMI 366227]